MKLLKIFGIVAGVHVVALVLIFANPGCSTTSKPRANPADTVMAPEPGPVVSVPNLAGSPAPAADTASTQLNAIDNGSPIQPAPIAFNPDAPAELAAGGRYSPTRPGTPVAKAVQAEPVSNVVPVSTYTVQRGDSLWSLAKKHGVSVADLAAANNLHGSSMLQIGQKLIIPGKSMTTAAAATASETKTAAAPAPKASAKGHAFTHEVKAGETLGAIARRYQVSIGEIATANNISDPAKIRPGQKLVIPGWKAPAAKPAVKPEVKPAEPAAVTQPAPAVNDSPIFVPPPSDQPLDEGLKPTAGAAPVIQVEDTNAPQKN